MNKWVWDSAAFPEDTELLANPVDSVAMEAKYHSKWLVSLYNRVRMAKTGGYKDTEEKEIMVGIVFAELVMYIAPVLTLADFPQLYMCRMKQLGVTLDAKVHTTRLKQRLLAQFPSMMAQKKGRDVLIAFEDAAMAKACDCDNNNDAVHLAHAVQIVRRHIYCQQDANKIPCHPCSLLSSIWYLKGPASRIKMKTKHLLPFPFPAVKVQQNQT